MGALKNHPGMTMRDDAAAAINAMEDKHGVIVINRAGVSKAVQQGLIDRWDKGGPANRPPNLFEPLRPPEKSEHVMGGGIAVDVYNYTSDRAKLNEFGFKWYGPRDPVHYTFTGWTPPATPTEEDDEMNEFYVYVKAQDKGYAIRGGRKRWMKRAEWNAMRNAGHPVLDVPLEHIKEIPDA